MSTSFQNNYQAMIAFINCAIQCTIQMRLENKAFVILQLNTKFTSRNDIYQTITLGVNKFLHFALLFR